MLKKLLVVMTLFGLAACAATSLETAPIKGEITNHGIIILADRKNIDDNTSPVGIRTEADDFVFSQTTTMVPAEIGTTFGIEFILSGGDSKDVPVLTRMSFPEINEQTSYERRRDIKIGVRDAMWYTFDVKEELALGKWVFEAFSGNTKLFEQHFRVVAP
jgi:hypothetical protein